MAKIYTSCKLTFFPIGKYYRLTATHRGGSREGDSTGDRIWLVGQFLVHMSFDMLQPKYVYTSEAEMLDMLELAYNIRPTLIN